MTTDNNSEAAFAKLIADADYTRRAVDDLSRKLEPLLLARSGDLATVARMERDLAHSFEKHRVADGKITTLEKRLDKALWTVGGAFAAFQIIWSLLGPSILKAFGFGG